MEKTKIILDCDPGSDDAVALLLALFNPKSDLLGVTVVNGNRILPLTLDNALRVVQFSGKNVPVYGGSTDPLVANLISTRKPGFPRVHLNDSHGDHLPLPEPTIKAQDGNAVDYLVEEFSKPDNDITLVTTGPLTNVAMALRMKPEIAKNIKQIVMMGGAIAAANISASAETNIYVDPEATKIVMDSTIPKMILPLDATWRACITSDEADELEKIGNKYTKFISQMIKLRIKALTVRDVTQHNFDMRHKKGTVASVILYRYENNMAPIHDALTVAYLIDPSVITEYIDGNVDIDIAGGLADGRLVVDYQNTRKSKDGITAKIALNADGEKFFNIIKDTLA